MFYERLSLEEKILLASLRETTIDGAIRELNFLMKNTSPDDDNFSVLSNLREILKTEPISIENIIREVQESGYLDEDTVS